MKFLSRLLGGAEKPEAPSESAEASASRAVAVEDPGAAPAGGHRWDFGALASAAESPVSRTASLVVDAAVTSELTPKVVEAIKTVFDPEIPVDIYELGLIYDIQADASRRVHVAMTLTSPACPSAQQLPSEVKFKVKAIPGVCDATVDVVWEPPWTKERMSDVARLHLGMF